MESTAHAREPGATRARARRPPHERAKGSDSTVKRHDQVLSALVLPRHSRPRLLLDSPPNASQTRLQWSDPIAPRHSRLLQAGSVRLRPRDLLLGGCPRDGLGRVALLLLLAEEQRQKEFQHANVIHHLQTTRTHKRQKERKVRGVCRLVGGGGGGVWYVVRGGALLPARRCKRRASRRGRAPRSPS